MGKRREATKSLTLTSLRQVSALAHPLRFRVFERLIDSPLTGKQLAEVLNTKPTKLYHHLKVLSRAGLIRKTATRRKRGATEKYYQAVSDRIAIDPQLFEGKVAAGPALLGEVLRVTLDEFLDAQRVDRRVSPKPTMLIKRLKIRTTRATVEQLGRTLDRWLDSFEAASDPNGDTECAVTVAFYPTKIGDARQKDS